ncbi:hypothetical protein OIV83_004960 [Microbotryomycetes sp. JL201]|nr:hypothetical protein OIV83_004960 [Microbotryomycetes sp. JL201]
MSAAGATAGPVKLEGFELRGMSPSTFDPHSQSTSTSTDATMTGSVDPSFLYGGPNAHPLFGNGSSSSSSLLFGHGLADNDFEQAAFAPTTTQHSHASNSVYDAFGFGKPDMFGLGAPSAANNASGPYAGGSASTLLTPHLQATSLASAFMGQPQAQTTSTTTLTTSTTQAPAITAAMSMALPPTSVAAPAPPPSTTTTHAAAAAAAAFHQQLQGLGFPPHVDSASHMFAPFIGTDTATSTAATLAQLTAQANLESMFNSIMSPVDFARRNSTPVNHFGGANNGKSPQHQATAASSSASTPGASFHPTTSPAKTAAPSASTSASANPGSRSKSLSQTRGRSASLTRRKQSPPDSGALTSASQERGRSNQRRSSSQVGKAPSSSARSRSARRNAAAYQSMGTGGAAAQASAAAAAAASSGSNNPSAIGSPALGPLGVPSPMASDDANGSHPIAMATIPSAPGSPNWYASSPQSTTLGTSAGTDHDFAASVDAGWKPTEGASPFGPSSLKGTALEDVPEDETKTAADVLTEKRRKRRESHNAVERRRRDNINERIQELATLLPEVLLEQACNAKDDDMPGSPGGSGQQAPSAAHLLPLPPLGTSPQQIAAMTAHLTHGTGNQVMGTAGNKPNKGVILAKSVEYIRYLQQLVELHTQRNVDLERMILELRSGANAQIFEPDFEHQGQDRSNDGNAHLSGDGATRSNDNGTDAFMSFEHFAAMSPMAIKEEMEG